MKCDYCKQVEATQKLDGRPCCSICKTLAKVEVRFEKSVSAEDPEAIDRHYNFLRRTKIIFVIAAIVATLPILHFVVNYKVMAGPHSAGYITAAVLVVAGLYYLIMSRWLTTGPIRQGSEAPRIHRY